MNCRDVEALLPVRRELSWAQEQAVREHLDQCPRCAALGQHIEHTQRVLRTMPMPITLPPDDLVPAIRSRLQRERFFASIYHKASYVLAYGVVGSVLVIFLFLTISFSQHALQSFGMNVQPTAIASESTAQFSAELASQPSSASVVSGNASEDLTVLLLGSDARPHSPEPIRTDSIIVVHLDRANGEVKMLSLPRSLWVTYPGHGEGTLGNAFTVGTQNQDMDAGMTLAKGTVSALLDIPIDYVALLDLEGFRELVDHLGGITINVPEPIRDPNYPTEDYGTKAVHFNAGLQHMDGERALMYVRTRYADNEFKRDQRQQIVFLAMSERVRDIGMLQQIQNIDDYMDALQSHLHTDMPKAVLVDLANWGRTLNIDDIDRQNVDETMVTPLQPPATFTIEPRELEYVVSQLTGHEFVRHSNDLPGISRVHKGAQ